MDIRDEDQESGEALPGLRDAELGGLLDGVDRVAAGVGETDHLRAGALRLEEEGREVGIVERMPDRAEDLAAGRLDRGGRFSLQGMPTRLVCGEEKTRGR